MLAETLQIQKQKEDYRSNCAVVDAGGPDSPEGYLLNMFAQPSATYILGVGEDKWEFDAANRVGRGSFGSIYLGNVQPASEPAPQRAQSLQDGAFSGEIGELSSSWLWSSC